MLFIRMVCGNEVLNVCVCVELLVLMWNSTLTAIGRQLLFIAVDGSGWIQQQEHQMGELGCVCG